MNYLFYTGELFYEALSLLVKTNIIRLLPLKLDKDYLLTLKQL